MSVRCINSNVCKIPITKLLKMAILHLKLLLLLELWLLLCGTTKYILGDYEVNVERKHKTAMKTEQELLKSCLHQLLKKLLKRLQRKKARFV
jgi:hypothetical protein